ADLAAASARQDDLVARLLEVERAVATALAGAQRGSRSDPLAADARASLGELRRLRRDQQRAAFALAGLASRLSEELQAARMVTAASELGGFGPMVRELARAQGKEAELVTSGLGVEADREVLQTLKDPVMHLLRNAVTHGIGPPAERLAAGKPAAGRVALRLAVDAGRLVTVVEDDGRGIDLARVRAAAVEQGLLGAGEPVTDAELHAILLRP